MSLKIWKFWLAKKMVDLSDEILSPEVIETWFGAI